MSNKPNRPVARIVFKHKETGEYCNEAEIPFWASKKPDMPPNPRFPEGAVLTLADGTKLRLDAYWTNFWDNRQDDPGF